MNELRKEIAIQQKKGLPFIMTSVIIWLLILLVSILDINMNIRSKVIEEKVEAVRAEEEKSKRKENRNYEQRR